MPCGFPGSLITFQPTCLADWWDKGELWSTMEGRSLEKAPSSAPLTDQLACFGTQFSTPK